MSNVVDFIKFKEKLEEQESLGEKDYIHYSDEVVEEIWSIVLQELVEEGCDFNSDRLKYFPTMILILESIRALYLQANGEEHSLQEFAAEALEEYDLEKMMKEVVDTEENMD